MIAVSMVILVCVIQRFLWSGFSPQSHKLLKHRTQEHRSTNNILMRSVALIVETNSLTGAHDRSTTCSFHLRWDCLQLGWRFPLLFYTLSSLPQTSLPLLPWLLGRYTRTPYLSRQFSIASWYPIANILYGSVLITASTSARRSRNPEWHYPPDSTFALKEWLSPPALTRTLLEQQVTLKQQTTFIWINWTWEWKHNQL